MSVLGKCLSIVDTPLDCFPNIKKTLSIIFSASFDLISRLTLPAITDRLQLSCRVIFLIGAILLTITRAILAETTDRTNLILMSALYGYVRAATVVNQNLTISEYAAQDKLASSLSLTMIMKGIFVMTIGQLLGN